MTLSHPNGTVEFNALARACCEGSLAIARQLKDKSRTANQLNTLGYIALRSTEYAKARSLFAESLTLFASLKSRRMLADVLTGMASTAVALRDARQAARLLGATQTLVDKWGIRVEDANQAEFERSVAAARAFDESGFQAAWEEGKAMPLEQVIALALGEPRSG